MKMLLRLVIVALASYCCCSYATLSCDPVSFENDQRIVTEAQSNSRLNTSIQQSKDSSGYLKLKIRCVATEKEGNSKLEADVTFVPAEKKIYSTFIISGEVFHKLPSGDYVGITIVAPNEATNDSDQVVKFFSYIVPSTAVDNRIKNTQDILDKKLVALKKAAQCFSEAAIRIHK